MDFLPLVINFIALIFFIGILENVSEAIENFTNIRLPSWLGFLIIWIVAYFIVWVGDWRFMSFLGYESTKSWGIWVELGLSSGIIAAGSDKLQKKFNLIQTIPTILSNIRGISKTRDPYDPTI